MATLRFALFGNVYQQHKSAAIRVLLNSLRSHGVQIFIEKEYFEFLRSVFSEFTDSSDYREFDNFEETEVDFAVSVGGDGTLLRTASRVGARQTPIVGVNMGRLGFLADGTAGGDITSMVNALCKGDYTLEDRALIHVDTDGEPLCGCANALNDVAILKRDTASMISIRAAVNDEFLTTYQADGLVVSTPTGSTAYSLSNGGPIIVPQTGVMLMTAVAPHSLNVRPLVLPDTATIELTVRSRSHTFLVGIDGRSSTLPEGTTLRLSRAPYVAKIVKRRGSSYFATLRDKMMWGADTR
jgi:NAD+ kinase